MMSKAKPDVSLLVRDLMTVGVTTCAPQTPLDEVARALLEKDLEAVVVLDENGHATGAVTWEEMIGAYASGDWQELTAEQVMHEELPQVPPEIPLTAAVQIMRDIGVRVLFVMHHAGGIEYPAATLSSRHLLRHMAAVEGEELADLGIAAKREPPLETFFRRRDEARRRAQSQE